MCRVDTPPFCQGVSAEADYGIRACTGVSVDGQLEDGVAGRSLVFEDVEAGGYSREVQTVGIVGSSDGGAGEAVERSVADRCAEEHGIVGLAVPCL